ncbi:helix-turn-helix domain-containing protein [Nocardia sp. NPDC058518]|uniref:helix-turn-helix domain-containing protein n=1 Tax=Nocardia sp. NPDC058518 TaxID=3346534 RepID=UPI00365A9846
MQPSGDRLDPLACQGVRPSGSRPSDREGLQAEPWLEILQAPERNGLTVTEVCRRYNISRKSYYTYLARYRAHGVAGLAPRSRRPKSFPARTSADIEAVVVRVRLDRPQWGARRIRTHLLRAGSGRVPAVSTVHAILRRHGLVGPGSDDTAVPPPAKEQLMTTHRTPSRAGSYT